MSGTSDATVLKKMSAENRARADKLREKRLLRKNKRKALSAKVVKTVASRPAGTEGISTNWERLKNAMGIKEGEPAMVLNRHKTVDKSQHQGPTKVLALDCEMVGVGLRGREHMLARVTLVNMHGNVIYDRYVKPGEAVVDYRTRISGIRPEDLQDGVELSAVQKEVSALLKDRILVGHDLRHDFDVMFLSHPSYMTRDTSLFRPFRDMFGGRTPSLKNLALRVLDLNIQEGEHSSAQDAQVAMKLYLQYRRRWENDIKNRINRMKRKLDRRKERATKLAQDKRGAQRQRHGETRQLCEQSSDGGDSSDEGTPV